MSQKFQKNKEDFVCEYCGSAVTGNGYTNHCPICLWSKHVDVYPGDRAAECGGLMRPKTIEFKEGTFELVHQCEKCGHEKTNKISPDDDISKYLARMV
jgi:hypothetical protein